MLLDNVTIVILASQGSCQLNAPPQSVTSCLTRRKHPVQNYADPKFAEVVNDQREQRY